MRRAANDTILDRPPLIYVWKPVYTRFVVPVVLPLVRVLRRLLFEPESQQAIPRLEESLAAALSGIEELRSDLRQGLNRQYIDTLGNLDALERSVVETMRAMQHAVRDHGAALQSIAAEQERLALQKSQDIQAITHMHREMTAALQAMHDAERARDLRIEGITQELDRIQQQLDAQRSEQAKTAEDLNNIVLTLMTTAHESAPRTRAAPQI